MMAKDPKPGQPVPELIPDRPSVPKVREAARGCKACDLYKRGTQTVFGEGPSRADVMMVGEQRGTFVESPLAPLVTATVHPSSILRAPDDEARREEMREFVADLKKVRKALRDESLIHDV